MSQPDVAGPEARTAPRGPHDEPIHAGDAALGMSLTSARVIAVIAVVVLAGAGCSSGKADPYGLCEDSGERDVQTHAGVVGKPEPVGALYMKIEEYSVTTDPVRLVVDATIENRCDTNSGSVSFWLECGEGLPSVGPDSGWPPSASGLDPGTVEHGTAVFQVPETCDELSVIRPGSCVCSVGWIPQAASA